MLENDDLLQKMKEQFGLEVMDGLRNYLTTISKREEKRIRKGLKRRGYRLMHRRHSQYRVLLDRVMTPEAIGQRMLDQDRSAARE